MAEPSEIVAVTGLDPAVVHSLVRALTAVDRRSARPADEPVVAENVDRREAEFADHLRAQVNAEVQLDEVRGDVLQLRVGVTALREELAATEERRAELHERLAHGRSDAAEQLAALSHARAQHARLERRKSDLEQALARGERKLSNLQRERVSVGDAHGELAESVTGLVSRVQRLVQAASSVGEEVDHSPPPGKEVHRERFRR